MEGGGEVKPSGLQTVIRENPNSLFSSLIRIEGGIGEFQTDTALPIECLEQLHLLAAYILVNHAETFEYGGMLLVVNSTGDKC